MSSHPINQLLALAAGEGTRLCPCCLVTDHSEAGTLDAPLRHAFDLTPVAAAACDVLIGYASRCHASLGTAPPRQHLAARSLRLAAAITLRLLPAVRRDNEGRYTVTLDQEHRIPTADSAFWQFGQAHQQLAGYLVEHDAGEWVDPNAVAGAVADLHDAARALEAVLELSSPGC